MFKEKEDIQIIVNKLKISNIKRYYFSKFCSDKIKNEEKSIQVLFVKYGGGRSIIITYNYFYGVRVAIELSYGRVWRYVSGKDEGLRYLTEIENGKEITEDSFILDGMPNKSVVMFLEKDSGYIWEFQSNFFNYLKQISGIEFSSSKKMTLKIYDYYKNFKNDDFELLFSEGPIFRSHVSRESLYHLYTNDTALVRIASAGKKHGLVLLESCFGLQTLELVKSTTKLNEDNSWSKWVSAIAIPLVGIEHAKLLEESIQVPGEIISRTYNGTSERDEPEFLSYVNRLDFHEDRVLPVSISLDLYTDMMKDVGKVIPYSLLGLWKNNCYSFAFFILKQYGIIANGFANTHRLLNIKEKKVYDISGVVGNSSNELTYLFKHNRIMAQISGEENGYSPNLYAYALGGKHIDFEDKKRPFRKSLAPLIYQLIFRENRSLFEDIEKPWWNFSKWYFSADSCSTNWFLYKFYTFSLSSPIISFNMRNYFRGNHVYYEYNENTRIFETIRVSLSNIAYINEKELKIFLNSFGKEQGNGDIRTILLEAIRLNSLGEWMVTEEVNGNPIVRTTFQVVPLSSYSYGKFYLETRIEEKKTNIDKQIQGNLIVNFIERCLKADTESLSEKEKKERLSVYQNIFNSSPGMTEGVLTKTKNYRKIDTSSSSLVYQGFFSGCNTMNRLSNNKFVRIFSEVTWMLMLYQWDAHPLLLLALFAVVLFDVSKFDNFAVAALNLNRRPSH